MDKRILRLALGGIGFLCIIVAIFSDFLRGRPFFLGYSQIAILVIGIFLIIFERLVLKNPTRLKALFTIVTNKGRILRKSVASTIDNLDKVFTDSIRKINIPFHNRSIYSSTIWKILNSIAFIIIFGLLFKYSLLQIANPSTDPWRTGDWLINYQGGFVRRGLLGEIILWFSHVSGFQVTVLVVITQLLFYLVFFISTYRLVILTSLTALNAALIYSPAFMLFTVFDPYGGFRKDIIFLAFLSWLCVNLTKKKKWSIALPLLIGIIAIVIVLSHEMLTAFLPYIICAFLIIEGGFSKRMWGIIAALLPAFLVSALVILFGRGDSLIVNDICASLLSAAPRNCLEGGAIGNLSHNIGLAHDVVRYYNDKETKNVYLLSLILGLIPILIYYFSRHVKKFFIGNRIKFWYLGAIMFTIILSLPLLWVVADYGRLIYIHIVSSSLMLFLINDKVNNQTITVNLWWVSSWVFSLLYIFGWRLIHIDASFNSVFPFMKIVNKLFS